MIGTVMRVGWLSLRRDRAALALTFLIPVLLFSIFAIVFGGQRDATSAVSLAVVDEDRSEASRLLVEALRREEGLRVRTRERREKDGTESGAVLDAAAARELVRTGKVPVALVLPEGFGASFPSFAGKGVAARLLADTSDPIAPQMVFGLLQKAVMSSAPDLLARGGIGEFDRYIGLTPDQRGSVDRWLGELRKEREPGRGSGQPASSPFSQGLVPVQAEDVLGARKANPVIAFYAAGVAVMFLLFSCTGAGGALLDELESGTLDRLLSSGLGMGRLLAGKWLFLTLLGVAQITVMFLWGAVVFRLELFPHLPGFAVMTTVTAAAAAGFGLALATASRSRAQFSGLSTILILAMSALGGSMFPRFLMSETLQTVGLATFNAWALDGYVKVFWRDAPLLDLWPQVGVLLVLTAAFLAGARALARRWESA